MLEKLKEEVWKVNIELPENHLVVMTSGNASGRDFETGFVIIKPSGVKYEELSPSDLVVVDIDGNIIEGNLKPSVDTQAHLYIYKQLKEIGGIVHTHSTYATAFAAMGRGIPLYLTELGDLFGGPIPISKYVPPGDEAIGKEFAKKTRPGRFRGILMKNHGVFAAGKTPLDALKAAVTIEHSARISYLAEMDGNPEELSMEEAKRLNKKYTENYGQ
ncbi:MAG: L-ribulose-5-phosphate 4-epimerase [candidate division WOR-3 bacterium]|nr:L-ribulose-5-phosphate 4-epimerase [candidate division WOR-3 bacterium]